MLSISCGNPASCGELPTTALAFSYGGTHMARDCVDRNGNEHYH